MLIAIDRVDNGQVSERIPAAFTEQDRAVRTRPRCPYPPVPRDGGRGSADEAQSFAGVAP